jgi:hypothetical protein
MKDNNQKLIDNLLPHPNINPIEPPAPPAVPPVAPGKPPTPTAPRPAAPHTNQKRPNGVWNPVTNQCEYVPRNKRKFIDAQANTVNKRIRTFAAMPGAQKTYF